LHVYADALDRGVDDFSAWYGGLSEGEKDDEVLRGEQAARDLAQESTSREPVAADLRRQDGEDDVEDFSDRS